MAQAHALVCWKLGCNTMFLNTKDPVTTSQKKTTWERQLKY